MVSHFWWKTLQSQLSSGGGGGRGVAETRCMHPIACIRQILGCKTLVTLIDCSITGLSTTSDRGRSRRVLYLLLGILWPFLLPSMDGWHESQTSAHIHAYAHIHIHIHTYTHTRIHAQVHTASESSALSSHRHRYRYSCVHAHTHTIACRYRKHVLSSRPHRYRYSWVCTHTHTHTSAHCFRKQCPILSPT